MDLRDRDIADALGWLADGLEVSDEARAGALAALRGPVTVADRPGPRLYYVQVDTMALENVDTEEAIWSAPADGRILSNEGALVLDLNDPEAAFRGSVVLLPDLADPVRLRALADRWEQSADPAQRDAWAAMVSRFLDPVVRGVARARP